jgi:pyridoxine 4-dehydrogenase
LSEFSWLTHVYKVEASAGTAHELDFLNLIEPPFFLANQPYRVNLSKQITIMTTLLNKKIGTTGFGLMGLTWRPKPIPVEDSVALMKSSLSKGANFWNGGVFYGNPKYNSLHVLNAYFTKYPEDASKVVISIKGGLDLSKHAVNGNKEWLVPEIEESIKLLDGKCKIDIFECARVDPTIPIEKTIEALAELVKAGKIGGIGLSECSASSIRRAAKVHKIASVEVEYSLFSTGTSANPPYWTNFGAR